VAYAAAPLDFGEALNKLRLIYLFPCEPICLAGVICGPCRRTPKPSPSIFPEYTRPVSVDLAMAACEWNGGRDRPANGPLNSRSIAQPLISTIAIGGKTVSGRHAALLSV